MHGRGRGTPTARGLSFLKCSVTPECAVDQQKTIDVVGHIRRPTDLAIIARAVPFILSYACFSQSVVAEELLFSFNPVPNNAALSERAFSKGEVLVVTITRMAAGDRLRLQRCGNTRCSVSAAVKVWTSDDFAQHSPAEVDAEDDRYSFLISNDDRVGVVGAEATAEQGVTTLRFSSGTVVTVAIRPAR